jgi:hypothetical protein
LRRVPDNDTSKGYYTLDELPGISTSPDWQSQAHYVLRDEVAIEDFEDGSLVLLCEQLRLVQLNPMARDIVGRLDGKRTVRQVAEAVAQAHGQPFDQVLSDVLDLLTALEAQGLVERGEKKQGVEGIGDMSDTRRYLVNPDVSCREEGPDGALLFNPDTDAMLVINPTGLLIWQALNRPRTRDEIVAHLLETCEDVPTDQVANDVDEFIQSLQPGGFIGEVLENDVQ